MIELSPELEDIFTDILLNHSEAVYDCIIAHCLSFDRKEVSISDECIKAIIDMIEKVKWIKLDVEQKRELEILKTIEHELQLKEWFAILMGIEIHKAINMDLWKILGLRLLLKNQNQDEDLIFIKNVLS